MNSLSGVGVHYRDTRASLFYLRAYDFLGGGELKVIKRIVTISEDADLPVEVKQLLNLKVMSVAKAKRDKMHGWKLDSDFICAYHSKVN